MKESFSIDVFMLFPLHFYNGCGRGKRLPFFGTERVAYGAKWQGVTERTVRAVGMNGLPIRILGRRHAGEKSWSVGAPG